uniref:Large ribosomal subunit protein uL29c n=1 Tax=Synarthrophyton chejuense TaxID=2485825 RepID=A0A3G3MFY5_9FLOR|nr:ribosomal protein L29 [Synarthrophyton chejuense]AYR05726.1 ribosomal protein L29 [Synarthrophyton chejuense]
MININEIKKLSQEEISNKIYEVKKEMFELKFKQATRQNIKTHLFKKYKHFLAQLLTIEHNNKNTK